MDKEMKVLIEQAETNLKNARTEIFRLGEALDKIRSKNGK